MWKTRQVLMEQAADGGAGGAASVAGAGAEGGAGTNGAAPVAGAAAQGASAQSPSALAAGAGAAGAAGGDTPNSYFVPEKYLVKQADGTVDEAASRKAFFEGHGALVKRIGTGDLPPKDANEYAVEKLPEGAPTWDEIKKDPEMQGFLKAAHAKGMTNAQLEFALDQYYQRAQSLVAGARELDTAAATEALGKVWADPAALDANMRHAYRATLALSTKSGISMDEIHGSLGNNPMFIRLMAAAGPEFREGDLPSTGGGGGEGAEQTIKTLMASEAYTNPKHPDFERVSKQVRDYYERKTVGR